MISQKTFGTTSTGKTADLFLLENKAGTKVEITNFGGTIVSLCVADKNGVPTDIVLGYDTIDMYEKQDKYIGALIGRFSNRIEKGTFTLNDKTYSLYCNDGNNHLHGGKEGFDKKLWQAKTNENSLILTYISPDGEENYPGNLTATVTYTLDDDNTLTIDYKAVSDADTVCGMTNHTYFNLGGYNSGNVLNQNLQILADAYTKADEEAIPHGEIIPVAGTPMDFTEPRKIGEHINDSYEQIILAGGYDSNWILRDYDGSLQKAAKAYDDSTGITMEVTTTLPGIQFYSGNFLDGSLPGKNHSLLEKHNGFCLETQYFPNSMAVDSFQKPILKKGDLYHQVTAFRFSIL